MSKLIKVVKDTQVGEEMDLRGLRATRIPSKIKRELRRKYAKKHTREL